MTMAEPEEFIKSTIADHSNCDGKSIRTIFSSTSNNHRTSTSTSSSSNSKTDINNYVKVGVRVRPHPYQGMRKNRKTSTVKFRDHDFVVRCPKNAWNGQCQEHIFQYDHMFWSCDSNNFSYPFSSQQDVYEAMGKPIVDNLIKGYNASLFVYGQVGSGKTYTMIGRNVDDIEDPVHAGILPRLGKDLFANLESYDGDKYKIEVTNYEIYKEKIYDLMVEKRNKVPLRVREHPNRGPYIENLTVRHVKRYEDLRECIAVGFENRMCTTSTSTTTSTAAAKSSKSHGIFCVTLTLELETGAFRIGRIWLVDLAGSERFQTNANIVEDDSISINRSLFTLGKVIAALGERKKGNTFVSYRDSVLTWLLRQCLGGNSLTSMIATVSPASEKVLETLSTLRYVKQARLIVGVATVNDEKRKTAAIATMTSVKEEEEVEAQPKLQQHYHHHQTTFRTRNVEGKRSEQSCGERSQSTESIESTTYVVLDDEAGWRRNGEGDDSQRNIRCKQRIQSIVGSLSKELKDEVILGYLKANNSESVLLRSSASAFALDKESSSTSTAVVGGGGVGAGSVGIKALKPNEVMACFTAIYELITSLKPKLCEEEFLTEAYKECRNAVNKFERVLWKHMTEQTDQQGNVENATINVN